MRLCVLLTFPPCFKGELPKELGNLVNLTKLFLNGNPFQGELYVPSYMRCRFADIFLLFYRWTYVCKRIAQGARRPRQFDWPLPE